LRTECETYLKRSLLVVPMPAPSPFLPPTLPLPPSLPLPPAASDHDGRECTLMSGAYAMLVQGLLVVAGVGTLLFKRWCERPRRPWLVWFFDASKQAVSGGLQHLINLVFGVLFAQHSTASECAWYLVDFCIFVVCGIFILSGFVAAYRRIVERYQLTMLRSGEYGNPPSWKPWALQMSIWGVLSCVEKLITALCVIVPLRTHLDALAAWIEQPVRDHPEIELPIVMLLAPTVLNMAFFVIVDNLIMRRGHGLRYRRFDEGLSPTSSPLPRLAALQESELSRAFLGADAMRASVQQERPRNATGATIGTAPVGGGTRSWV